MERKITNGVHADERKWKFEINDLRVLIQVVNVALIIIVGLQISWFGLTIAVLGLCKDIFIDKKINGSVMHLSTIILNIYFLMLFYGVI